MRTTRIQLVLGLIIVAGSLHGCSTAASLIQTSSDFLGDRAQQMQLAQARTGYSLSKFRHKLKKKDECVPPKHPHAKECLLGDGHLEDILETELNLVVENGLELAGFELDFDEIKEMAKQQARYDDAYEEALKAWHEIEAVRKSDFDKQQANQMYCDDGCTPLPDCAQPPAKEYVQMPRPKRQAVGMDNGLPLIIRANAKMNPTGMQYSRSQIRHDYVPKEQVKQPCCPQCGRPGCSDKCDTCTFYQQAPIPPMAAAGTLDP